MAAGDPPMNCSINPWQTYTSPCQECLRKDVELQQLRAMVAEYRELVQTLTPIVHKAFDVITKERK